MTGDRLFAELTAGRPRWDLWYPFPRQAEPDRLAGDRAVGEVGELLAAGVDPLAADEGRFLPDGLVDQVRRHDLLRLQLDPADGGRGLSDFNMFRLVVAASSWSVPAGFLLATHGGIGLPSLVRVVDSGHLRRLLLRRLADGALSGWADTEPAGAANSRPATIAKPTAAGGYALTGEKVFISNGALADELIVSAATPDGQAGLFLVDTASSGFRAGSRHELVGMRGAPVAPVAFADVPVPAERVIVPPAEHWRAAPLLEPISALGRMYIVAATATAIARLCLRAQRDFANRRAVDGVPLGRYQAVQHLIARSVADVYAMDTAVRWCLLGDDADNLTSRHLERVAAKNITSVTCWRVVDRTVSLLGAEGLETASSKLRRGVPAHPVERMFRDARMLRVTGGVDFAVDLWAGEAMLRRHYDRLGARAEPYPGDPQWTDRLPAGNVGHVRAVTAGIRRLADTCRELTTRYADPDALLANECTVIALQRIATELFTMAAVLARAATEAPPEQPYPQHLADIVCRAARRRLADLWQELRAGERAVVTEVSDGYLAGDAGRLILSDLVPVR